MIEQEKQPGTPEEFIRSLGNLSGYNDAIKFVDSLIPMCLDKKNLGPHTIPAVDTEEIKRLAVGRLGNSGGSAKYREAFWRTVCFVDGNYGIIDSLAEAQKEMGLDLEKPIKPEKEFIKSLGIKFYSPEGRMGVVDAIKFGKLLKSDVDKEKVEEDMERLLKFSNKDEEYKETFRKTARFFEGNFEIVTVLEKTLEEMLPKNKVDPLIGKRINLRDILSGYTVGSLLKNFLEVRAEKQFKELTDGMSSATLSEVCGDLIRVESGYQSRFNSPNIGRNLDAWIRRGVFKNEIRRRVEYITEMAQDVK